MPASSASSSPSLADLRRWIERFESLRVLVWGDIVADRFLYGSTTRVSREAPALVLKHEDEEVRPGGAGNAMLNVAALGAKVAAVGFIGGDAAGEALCKRLREGGVDTDHLVRRHEAGTPVKTRVMAGGVHTVRQQVLRIDQDRPWETDSGSDDALVASFSALLDDVDAVLISDYGLGSVDSKIYHRLLPELGDRSLPRFLDSRSSLMSFPGITAATPNQSEVEAALHVELDDDIAALETAGRRLLQELSSEVLIVTRGSKGMTLFEPDADPLHIDIHGTEEIADVTGAGDTVIATFTLGYVAGASAPDAARLSNVAGGLAVMKRGTATVSAAELDDAIARGE
jgi:rfaE bifunctional protein kinase chain/domain